MGNIPSSKQDVVRYIRSLGLKTFPLPPDRKSPPPEKFYDLASNHGTFDETHSNVGISTGGGVVVLDFDGEAGMEQFVELGLEGLIPDTLIVATPSGGRHVYLASGETEFRNAVKKLSGMDVRGHHGYVVAPGSTVDGKPYTIVRAPSALKPIPPAIAARLTAKKAEPVEQVPLVDLDDPDNIKRAIEYLTRFAPMAVEGSNGSAATYQTAARLKDLGISEPTAVDLMLEHWNDTNAFPPWSPEDIATPIANAYRYATDEPPGSKTPQADTTPLPPEELARIEATRRAHALPPEWMDQPDTTPQGELKLQPLSPFSPTDIRPREYVMGRFLAKRFVTSLISPPGVGKTTFGLSAALAIATGRNLLGDAFEVHAPANVFYWTQEDDLDEVRMRILAAARHHNVDLTPEVFARLHIHSGVERPLTVAVLAEDRRQLLPSKNAADVLKYLQANKCVAAVFDPFVEFHPANENDNNEISQVARIFRRMATLANCAVGIVHHSRKQPQASSEGSAGDMDSGRGASSLSGVVRVSATLYGLDAKTAEAWGIPEDRRHRYVRFDDAKSNLSLMRAKPLLFERRSVFVPELDDEIGVLVPADLGEVVREAALEDTWIEDLGAAISAVSEGSPVHGRGADMVALKDVAACLREGDYRGGGDTYRLADPSYLRRRIKSSVIAGAVEGWRWDDSDGSRPKIVRSL